MTIRHGLAAAAALLLAAQPCLAAELPARDGSRHSGVFAGAFAKLPLGSKATARDEGRVGFRLGASHVYRGAHAGLGERRIEADFVEIGMFGSGRKSLTLGGRQLVGTDGKLRLADEDGSGGGVSTWVIVGGVVVLALGVGYLVLLDAFDCTDEDECT
jgi:hypothetical protein